jgi:hypothetical protein
MDGVQKLDAHLALNQTQKHDGKEGDISPGGTSILGLLGVLH